MKKNFMDKHIKLIMLLVITAGLILLGVTAFNFMHSQKTTAKIRIALQGNKDIAAYSNTDLMKEQ